MFILVIGLPQSMIRGKPKVQGLYLNIVDKIRLNFDYNGLIEFYYIR